MPLRLRNKLAVLGVKMEYLEEWGFEMLLADELARWWAAILLHPQPNCELVVSHYIPQRIFSHDQKVNAPILVTLVIRQYSAALVNARGFKSVFDAIHASSTTVQNPAG